MKKFFPFAAALVLLLTLTACGTDAPDAADIPEAEAVTEPAAESSLTMGTGDSRGLYYAVGGAISTAISRATDGSITVDVVQTHGSEDNLEKLALGVYQIATVQSDVMSYAYTGTNSFAVSGAITNFRVLCGLYAETVQIVTVDPEIKSVADLAGKKVCVGDKDSGTYFNAVDILAAYDMTLSDVEPVCQSFGESAESLQNGEIAAAVITAGAPTPAVETLAAEKAVYLLSIDEAHMAKLLADSPYYAAYTIPAGTYETDADVTTVTTKATLVCNSALSDDQAYAVVSAIFNSETDVAALCGKDGKPDPVFAAEGIIVPFHKGAARYFAEQGIDVTAK